MRFATISITRFRPVWSLSLLLVIRAWFIHRSITLSNLKRFAWLFSIKCVTGSNHLSLNHSILFLLLRFIISFDESESCVWLLRLIATPSLSSTSSVSNTFKSNQSLDQAQVRVCVTLRSIRKLLFRLTVIVVVFLLIFGSRPILVYQQKKKERESELCVIGARIH